MSGFEPDTKEGVQAEIDYFESHAPQFAAAHQSIVRDVLSDDQLCNEIDDLTTLESGLQSKVAAVRRAKGDCKKERIRRGLLTRTVSDHALVRYLERCKGFDMETFRDELRRMVDESAPSKDGECLLHPTGTGLIVGQDGQIVTVLGADQIRRWTTSKTYTGSAT